MLQTAARAARRTTSDAIALYERSLTDVPGWLDQTDFVVMQLIDEIQDALGLGGDILEIGVYQGRTAILLQYFCRGSDRLSVCDIFEDPVDTDEDRRERDAFYTDLTRASFEQHFRRYHPALPEIYQCRSQDLAPRLRDRSFRFVHVDGGHLHAVVRGDIELAKQVLAPGGVVAVDDYRREHTPGVAAAVWEQVLNGGLVPICLTPGKLYGCWEHPEWYPDRLADLAGADPALRTEDHVVLGRRVIRMSDASVEGPSREQFLAVQLETLQKELAAQVKASTEDSLRAKREIDRVTTELEATGRRLQAAAREIEEKEIELAKRNLSAEDLQLRIMLLESAIGIRRP